MSFTNEVKAIDIGLNLMDKRYNKDRDAVVLKASQDGIGIIITGCSEFSNKAALDYIKRNPSYNLKCTIGIHPHNADFYSEEFKKEYMEQFAKNRKHIVAVGEIGLDYDRMISTKHNQKTAFSDMIRIARMFDMPMFLHERRAVEDFYNILKENRDMTVKSVVHCFTGTKETVRKYLELGCMIGITGWICDPRRNQDLVEAVKYIPLDRIMVETDGPYLLPKGISGRRNEPSNLHYVWEKIAEVIGKDSEDVRILCLKNTKSFFNM